MSPGISFKLLGPACWPAAGAPKGSIAASTFLRHAAGRFTFLVLVALGPSPGNSEPGDADNGNSSRVLLEQPLFLFNNVDWAEYLELRRPWGDCREGVVHYALKAIGQPFRSGALRFDWTESDCVVFVERCIAGGLSSNWSEFYRLSERLRHRDGRVDVLERNYFTLTDWVPNNTWLLRDVTDEIGCSSRFVHTTYPRRFFVALDFGADATPEGQAKAMARALKVATVPDKLVTAQSYLPAETIAEVSPNLQMADILLVIRRFSRWGQAPWLDCDHMMIAAPADGVAYAIHSSRLGVQRIPLSAFFRLHPHVAGVKVLRLCDDARQRVSEELLRLSSLPVPDPGDVDAAVLKARELRR